MSDPAPKAIFLSYARDDAAAARRVAEALRSSGLEVWFDENELRGGDTWDAKIRKQIDACALFIPIISQTTESRAKGYFRLEWNLAVAQTQMLAEGVPFIAPVVIDDTKENGASVPADFLKVQWMRLPGALPTPQFVDQVKRLLEAPTKPATKARVLGASASSAAPRGGIPPWVWAAAVAVIGGVAFFATRPSPKEPAAPTSAAKPVATAAPVSEARQLAAKARALYEQWDLASNEDFALAEQLLKKAIELDPAEGEVWASHALLCCIEAISGRDRSEARMAAARSSAERAIKLAPELPLARFAYAFGLRLRKQSEDEAIRLLREEATRQPLNRMVIRTLASALRNAGQLEQSLVYFDKAAALPGNDPQLRHNRAQSLERLGRFAEAEAENDEALALSPLYRGAIEMKVRLLLNVRGDLVEARQLLEKLPADFFLTDNFGAQNVGLVWLYSHEPAKSINALQRAPDWLEGQIIDGPKAYFTGLAHRMAGNIEAARTDWRSALQAIDRKLTTEPNSSALLVKKAAILATLGERIEAEQLLREITQRKQVGDGQVSEVALARTLMLLEKSDQAIDALESATKGFSAASLVRTYLRYSPEWDPLRGNPRFEALLKMPEKKK